MFGIRPPTCRVVCTIQHVIADWIPNNPAIARIAEEIANIFPCWFRYRPLRNYRIISIFPWIILIYEVTTGGRAAQGRVGSCESLLDRCLFTGHSLFWNRTSHIPKKIDPMGASVPTATTKRSRTTTPKRTPNGNSSRTPGKSLVDEALVELQML